MAVLENPEDIQLLRPASLWDHLTGHSYKGAILLDEGLKKLAAEFNPHAAGFEIFSYSSRSDRRVMRTISAYCNKGEVEPVDFKLNGIPAANSEMKKSLFYLQGVFQEFANIVTPYFGDRYKIRLEDRSGLYHFHSDKGLMIGSLGLDADCNSTLLKNRYGKIVQPENGAMPIVLPEKIHSSPDVRDRPVLTAQRPWSH